MVRMRDERKICVGIGLLILTFGLFVFMNSPYSGQGLIYEYTELIVPCDVVNLDGVTLTCNSAKNTYYADGASLIHEEWVHNVMLLDQFNDAAVIRVRSLLEAGSEYSKLSLDLQTIPHWYDTNKNWVGEITSGDRVYWAGRVAWEPTYQDSESRLQWIAIDPEGLRTHYMTTGWAKHGPSISGSEIVIAPSTITVDSATGADESWELFVTEAYKLPTGTKVIKGSFNFMTVKAKADTDLTPLPPSISCALTPRTITDENVLASCNIEGQFLNYEVLYVNGVPYGNLNYNANNKRFEQTIDNNRFVVGSNSIRVEVGYGDGLKKERQYTVTKKVVEISQILTEYKVAVIYEYFDNTNRDSGWQSSLQTIISKANIGLEQYGIKLVPTFREVKVAEDIDNHNLDEPPYFDFRSQLMVLAYNEMGNDLQTLYESSDIVVLIPAKSHSAAWAIDYTGPIVMEETLIESQNPDVLFAHEVLHVFGLKDLMGEERDKWSYCSIMAEVTVTTIQLCDWEIQHLNSVSMPGLEPFSSFVSISQEDIIPEDDTKSCSIGEKWCDISYTCIGIFESCTDITPITPSITPAPTHIQPPPREICGNGIDDDGDGMVDTDDKDSKCYKPKSDYMKYLEDPRIGLFFMFLGGSIILISVRRKKR